MEQPHLFWTAFREQLQDSQGKRGHFLLRAKTAWLAYCNKTDAERRYNISSEVLQEANSGEEEKDKAGTYISAIKINLAWKQPTSPRDLKEHRKPNKVQNGQWAVCDGGVAWNNQGLEVTTWKNLSGFVSQCLIAGVKFAIQVKMAKRDCRVFTMNVSWFIFCLQLLNCSVNQSSY